MKKCLVFCFSILAFFFNGCRSDPGESLTILNSSNSSIDDVEIAFLDKSIEVAETTKIDDLDDAVFRFRFGYIGDGKDTSYAPIFEVPSKVLITWTANSIHKSSLLEVPEIIKSNFENNRNEKEGKSIELMFEISDDTSVDAYLKLTQHAPMTRQVSYIPDREQDENGSGTNLENGQDSSN